MILLYQTRFLKAIRMTKNTFSVNGGAMPALSHHQLIDQATGETNIWVLKALVRRQAMADYGAITPRSLRSAIRYYGDLLAQMQSAWRDRHGEPVDYVMVTPYGKSRDGVRRSAF
jgi:hypothetical protein